MSHMKLPTILPFTFLFMIIMDEKGRKDEKKKSANGPTLEGKLEKRIWLLERSETAI